MFNTCVGGKHINMKIPKTVRQHWVYKKFSDKEEKEGGVLDFQSENGQFTGS